MGVYTGKANGLICTHCGESSHSKQRYYGIIGYPDLWNFIKKTQKNIEKNMVNLTKAEQVQPMVNVVHPCTIGKKFIYSLSLLRIILGLLIQVHPIIWLGILVI